MDNQRQLCVGVFVGAHGVRGQLRLRSLTHDPEAIFTYGPLSDEKGTRQFVAKPVGLSKDAYLVKVKGVDDRTTAEGLRGTKLFVARDILPEAAEGEYYEADLIGLAVRSAEPRAEGKVLTMHDYGAGSFLEIKPVSGSSYMLPFTDACVPVVDLAGGFIEVVVPEGWLTAEKPPKKKKEAIRTEQGE